MPKVLEPSAKWSAALQDEFTTEPVQSLCGDAPPVTGQPGTGLGSPTEALRAPRLPSPRAGLFLGRHNTRKSSLEPTGRLGGGGHLCGGPDVPSHLRTRTSSRSTTWKILEIVNSSLRRWSFSTAQIRLSLCQPRLRLSLKELDPRFEHLLRIMRKSRSNLRSVALEAKLGGTEDFGRAVEQRLDLGLISSRPGSPSAFAASEGGPGEGVW